jgi:translation initiation factor IF-3
VNIASERQLRVNERIRVPQVRLIDHEGTQVGVISTHEALSMAREVDMDLVEVAPMERPPVCRIMDFGKQKYRQKKKQKKHVHEQQLKEVRLRPNTDKHDLEVKTKRAHAFLKRGDRVQFTMLMRGRERFHVDKAIGHMREMADSLTELGYVERHPRAEGRRITMVMVPGKPTAKGDKGQSKQPRPARPAPQQQPAQPQAAPQQQPSPQASPAPASTSDQG